MLTRQEAIKLITELNLQAFVQGDETYNFDVLIKNSRDRAIFEEHTAQPLKHMGNDGDDHLYMFRPWNGVSSKRF